MTTFSVVLQTVRPAQTPGWTPLHVCWIDDFFSLVTFLYFYLSASRFFICFDRLVSDIFFSLFPSFSSGSGGQALSIAFASSRLVTPPNCVSWRVKKKQSDTGGGRHAKRTRGGRARQVRRTTYTTKRAPMELPRMWFWPFPCPAPCLGVRSFTFATA